jgi:hypothetical protein
LRILEARGALPILAASATDIRSTEHYGPS